MTRFLTVNDVAKRLGVSRASIWRWSKEGAFPTPIKITQGCTRWALKDLEAWEKEKMGEAA